MGTHPESELGELANPGGELAELDLAGFEPGTLRGFLEAMLTIRSAEEEIASLIERGLARAPCHLGIGQEAIAVGVSYSLRRTDRVFGGHRSHSHYLALGGSVRALIAEVLGKLEGTSRGMGGSMHLYGKEVGFYGSVPLVGATIPLAVGAAIAARMDGTGDVGVTYFGDGATEEGVFHESMNLAAAFSLPVLFVCENNLFSSHLHISLRQPSDRIGRYGEAHRVATATVDGNDVTAVARTTAALLENVRAGKGPALLEAVTYRHRGHVGPKFDIDVGVQRSVADLDRWKRRDPISRLIAALIDARTLSARDCEDIQRRVRDSVLQAVRNAEAAPYPPTSALLDLVYAGVKG
jgi:acetoin:2,6-dichlorophenolindophenol oxidoreductase subunit alpha